MPLSTAGRWRLSGALRMRLPAMGCLLLALSPEVGAMTCRQAPMLAEAVRRGELPPLAERLPPEPMVVTPAHEIGRYVVEWKPGSHLLAERNPTLETRWSGRTATCASPCRWPSTGS